MSTLVIHPKDSTTTFLKPIYAPILDKTIIDGGVNKIKLKELIDNHDRIIMLGHGSPQGLFSSNQFSIAEPYIVDDSMVDLLSKKTNNVFIWCNADLFVQRNALTGFYCGMFISEINEAWYYNFHDLEDHLIDESNDVFSSIVSRNINQPPDVMYKNVIHEYGLLALSNPIAQFNLERLYFTGIKNYSKCNTFV